MSLNDGILPGRFQISHHRQYPPGLAQVLKVGTKLCTLVHDQNFHSVIMFEPELSQCGKGLGSCHALPACALVVTCPMTDDVRYSNWIFSIQRIPNFHRVDATNLIEVVTFRQSCCLPSSRHRSCFALWTKKKITFHPSDDSSSAATISQGTTKFSVWWVPQIDVGSQQLSLLYGRWSFLIHFSFCSLVCAIKFFSQVWFSVCGGHEIFTVVSRALHQLCRAISVQTAWRGWELLLVSQF